MITPDGTAVLVTIKVCEAYGKVTDDVPATAVFAIIGFATNLDDIGLLRQLAAIAGASRYPNADSITLEDAKRSELMIGLPIVNAAELFV